jgi:rubrerythrin
MVSFRVMVGRTGRAGDKNRRDRGMRFGSLRAVLDFAIRREEEAAKTYAKLGRVAGDEAARKLLADLRQEEINHKRILKGLTNAKVRASASKDVGDLMISDYLMEEPLTRDMNFQDLLIFAAKKEKKATELYSDLARNSLPGRQKALFEYLSKQERAHKLRLELEYEKHVLWDD